MFVYYLKNSTLVILRHVVLAQTNTIYVNLISRHISEAMSISSWKHNWRQNTNHIKPRVKCHICTNKRQFRAINPLQAPCYPYSYCLRCCLIRLYFFIIISLLRFKKKFPIISSISLHLDVLPLNLGFLSDKTPSWVCETQSPPLLSDQPGKILVLLS